MTELSVVVTRTLASGTRRGRTTVKRDPWPGVLSGAVLTFAHTLGEFGVVLMVGGNIPGRTRTLSIAIFDHVEALEYGAAHRTAGLLLAISFAVLALVYALQRRPAVTWNAR